MFGFRIHLPVGRSLPKPLAVTPTPCLMLFITGLICLKTSKLPPSKFCGVLWCSSFIWTKKVFTGEPAVKAFRRRSYSLIHPMIWRRYSRKKAAISLDRLSGYKVYLTETCAWRTAAPDHECWNQFGTGRRTAQKVKLPEEHWQFCPKSSSRCSVLPAKEKKPGSTNVNIDGVRGLKQRFGKRSEGLGCDSRDISERLKHIFRMWWQRRRSILCDSVIGWTKYQ